MAGPDRTHEFLRQFATRARHNRKIWPDSRHCGRVPDTSGLEAGSVSAQVLLHAQSSQLAGAGAVDGAHAHDTKLRQIGGTRPGPAAARLPRNRFLCGIGRAGLSGGVCRWPQSAADRELASLWAANQSYHLACVLAYALASEPEFAAAGFIERERAGGARFVADAANKFDRLW